jgi:soluble P-type ATPase
LLEIAIPGRGKLQFEYLVLDLNGTIALDGEIIEGVKEKLLVLDKSLSIVVVTADTYGSAQKQFASLPVKLHIIDRGNEDAQKQALVQELGGRKTVSIGNGSNDVSMLKESALGICVIGMEGAAVKAMSSSDVIVPEINSALDLLIRPDRLIATLRR